MIMTVLSQIKNLFSLHSLYNSSVHVIINGEHK